MERQARESMDALAARFDAAMAAERIDADWSGKTVQAIRGVFHSRVPGVELVDASCASTMCRVSVSHSDPESQLQMSGLIASVEPFKTGSFYRYHRDTHPPTTDVYVVREGAKVPSAEGD